MTTEKSRSDQNHTDMKLSDDELENVNGAESLNLSILHPIDSWGKVFGKLFEPFKHTIVTLGERSKRAK